MGSPVGHVLVLAVSPRSVDEGLFERDGRVAWLRVVVSAPGGAGMAEPLRRSSLRLPVLKQKQNVSLSNESLVPGFKTLWSIKFTNTFQSELDHDSRASGVYQMLSIRHWLSGGFTMRTQCAAHNTEAVAAFYGALVPSGIR